MTEPRGVSAGWRTTAVVAPAAAAAFAVATGWAVQHPPATAATAATSAATTAGSPAGPVEPPFEVDRTQVSLQSRAQALHARVTRLERALARLRTPTEALRQAPLQAGGSGAQPGAGSTAYSAGGGSVAPPPMAAAPAPATHTSTGASGTH